MPWLGIRGNGTLSHALPRKFRLGGFWASIRTTFEFPANSFGATAGTLGWPFSGAVLPLFTLTGLAFLLPALRVPGRERFRAAGLLVFLSAAESLALVIGGSRGGLGKDAGFAPRYVTLMTPALACLYYIWQVYAPAAVARFLQMSVFALACAVLPLNWSRVLQFAQSHNQQMKMFKKDLLAGTAAHTLAQRYGLLLGRGGEALQAATAGTMITLRRAGMDLFQHLQDSDAGYIVSIPVSGTSIHQVQAADVVEGAFGDGSYRILALAEPEVVSEIRLQYSHQGSDPPAWECPVDRRK
jgi:hypothetical protein